MKKIISLILSAVLLFSLSSCYQLDEIKEKVACWENEEHTEMSFRGDVYKKFVISVPGGDKNEYFFDNMRSCRVDEKDVPLLIAESVGDWISYNEIGGIPWIRYDYAGIFLIEEDYLPFIEITGAKVMDGFCSYDSGEKKFFDREDAEFINSLEYERRMNIMFDEDCESFISFYRSSSDEYIDEMMPFTVEDYESYTVVYCDDGEGGVVTDEAARERLREIIEKYGGGKSPEEYYGITYNSAVESEYYTDAL